MIRLPTFAILVACLLLAACTVRGTTDVQPTPMPATSLSTSASAGATAPAATLDSGPGGCTLRADYIGQSTVPDNQQLMPGTAFVQTWAVRNMGTCTWGDGYGMVFVGGEAFEGPVVIAVPATAPGAVANLTVQLAAPTQAGTYSGSWAIRAGNAVTFGQHTITIHVTAASTVVIIPTAFPSSPPPPTAAPTPLPSATAARCTPGATFVSDVTIPQGTTVTPGTPFIKTWRVRNTGSCQWGRSYLLIFQAGDPMGAPPNSVVPFTSPGALADISLTLIAPAHTGSSFARWALQDGAGDRLLDLELVITVVQDRQVTATTTPTIDPIHEPVPQSVSPTITPTMMPTTRPVNEPIPQSVPPSGTITGT